MDSLRASGDPNATRNGHPNAGAAAARDPGRYGAANAGADLATHAWPHPERDVDAHRHRDAHTGAHGEPDGDTHAYANGIALANAPANGVALTHACADAFALAQPDATAAARRPDPVPA
jgi:hypothetical protein